MTVIQPNAASILMLGDELLSRRLNNLMDKVNLLKADGIPNN